MKINNSQAFSHSFTSKKPTTRRADDFVRKVNLEFPAFSTSYAGTFWETLKEGKKYIENKKRFTTNIHPKLDISRKEYKEKCENQPYPIDLLKCSKKYRVANCGEKSWITLGALYANGFYDSEKVHVGIMINVIDKRSGEIKFSKTTRFDHDLVVSTLNKDADSEQDLIFIDSWLNKAMSHSEAKNTYKALIGKKELLNRIKEAKKEFIKENTKNFGIFGKKLPFNFNIKNYEFKPKVVFLYMQNRFELETEKEKEIFGKAVAKEFPELIINEK